MNDTDHEETEAPPRQSSFLSVPVILVVGLIIYEVTHNPGMAAMAMCLKFGWEDFRTARWLNRTDPDRGRGRACSWLYIAAGLWQTAIIGVAMVFLTIALDQLIQVGQQGQGAVVDLLSLLHGALTAIVVGFVLSTMATFIALRHARRYRVQPWLNGAVHIARRRDEWPPLYGHRNRALRLLISAALVTCFFLLPVFLFLLAAVLNQLVRVQALVGILATAVFFGCLILLATLAVLIRDLHRSRFFAQHPADCWGDEPLSSANKMMEERRERVKSV